MRAFAVVLAMSVLGCGTSDDAPDAAVSDGALPDAGAADGASAADASSVAAALSGLRWEIPCITDTTAELCTTGTANITVMATVSGSPGASHDIGLRFRGVIEPKTYAGGTRVGFFQTGGTPSSDTANVYRLTVSDPAQTFYVNAGTTRLSTMLYCEAIDYLATIRARTGATVTLTAEPRDALQIQNRDMTGAAFVVPGVTPAPAAFDGQFVQMDVVSVQTLP